MFLKSLKIQNNSVLIKDYEVDVNSLSKIKSSINRVSTKIGRLELRKELINESALELDQELSQLNTTKIRKLYNEAKSLIPDIQKTFEETLSFHNGMIMEKKKYITKEIPSLDLELKKAKEKLSQLISKERKLQERS